MGPLGSQCIGLGMAGKHDLLSYSSSILFSSGSSCFHTAAEWKSNEKQRLLTQLGFELQSSVVCHCVTDVKRERERERVPLDALSKVSF